MYIVSAVVPGLLKSSAHIPVMTYLFWKLLGTMVFAWK